MEKTHPCVITLLFAIAFYLLVETTVSEPRAQVLDLRCGTVLEHNITAYMANFVATMEQMADLLRTNGYGIAQAGTGPDVTYGLAQCYGDLSLVDCVLCYGEARGRLPACFPYISRCVYLDGCFMRVTNYTFYDEISGPDDLTLCGNVTRKGTRFQESARRALLKAATVAPDSGGFARPEVLVPGSRNDSAYVLANCWRTLNASACRACLANASSSAMKCLPWSEARVRNTGCFLRYSDTNFLNVVPSGGGSKVSKGVIIAIATSSGALLVIGALVGLHIRKNRIIQNKRRGPHDVKKMAKTLNDSSLNFKFTTLQKATGSFDDANKLGQGGFGIVYKGVLADGREIAVKRLFVNNKLRAADFFNEVNLISSVEHKNLVRLLGCSCSGPESLLVYEFLPNTSLDHFLFGTNSSQLLYCSYYGVIFGS